MLEQLNDKLIQIKVDWALRNSIADKLKQANEFLKEERKRLADLEKILSAMRFRR